MKNVIIILVAVLLTSQAFGQSCFSERYKSSKFHEVTIYEDILYSKAIPYANQITKESKEYYFDFYEPTGDTLNKRPLVLMFAGGDFQKGGKENGEVKTWCDSLARYGYTCAAIDFRLGYDKKRPESVERAIYRSVQDARAAVRFFTENHLTFKIDTNKIFVGGDESGAVTALYTAYMSEDEQRFKSSYGFKWEQYDLGCLDCAGNPFEQPVNIAGVINLRGELTDNMLQNAKDKIPVMHVHDDADNFRSIDPTKNPLDHLQMKGSLHLHEQMARKDIPSEVFFLESEMSAGINMDAISMTQIWNSVWTNIHGFLYSTLVYKAPTPIGLEKACAGGNSLYEVPSIEGADYCWKVEGGTIVKESGNQIEVKWKFNVKEGKVFVVVKNDMEVVSQISDPLNVKFVSAPKSDFEVTRITENIIAIQDNSSAGAFFSMDFGDGSDPRVNQTGYTLFHSYSTSGEFILSQVLEGECGTAVNTRKIEVTETPYNDFSVYLEDFVKVDSSIAKGKNLEVTVELPLVLNSININIKDEANLEVVKQKATNAESSLLSINTKDLEVGKYTLEVVIDGVNVIKSFTILEIE